MIARLEGLLESVGRDALTVQLPAGLTLHVLVPAFVAGRVGQQIGQRIQLFTLFYFESQAQGATMYPRLAGFLTAEDRAFFELFTTCKGIGHRKALRAMALPSHQIAAAIAERDVALLQSLPEIGKRTAETIIASLKGRVDAFLAGPGSAAAQTTAAGRSQSSDAGAAAATGRTSPSATREAMEVLVQLGENRVQVMTWIDQLMQQDEPPRDAEGLIAAIYRLKSGG